MNIEELDILKELSEQKYFGDLLFSYYADLIGKLLTVYEKEKEKNSKIDEFCRKELAFKRRLQRENRQPDEFNQGRFYVSENIRKIIEEE